MPGLNASKRYGTLSKFAGTKRANKIKRNSASRPAKDTPGQRRMQMVNPRHSSMMGNNEINVAQLGLVLVNLAAVGQDIRNVSY